jgi:hypothetical protein
VFAEDDGSLSGHLGTDTPNLQSVEREVEENLAAAIGRAEQEQALTQVANDDLAEMLAENAAIAAANEDTPAEHADDNET